MLYYHILDQTFGGGTKAVKL